MLSYGLWAWGVITARPPASEFWRDWYGAGPYRRLIWWHRRELDVEAWLEWNGGA